MINNDINDMNNIFLCGFMGCGKSTVAKLISQHSSLKLIDTDAEIKKHFKLGISEIFLKFGEQKFRNAETQILKKIIQNQNKNLIIATGGATLILNNNFKLLNNFCKIILIDTDFKICFDRIKNSKRPLIKKYNFNELKQIFTNRQKLYKKIAHEIINEQSNMSVETKLTKILKLIEQFQN